MKKKNVLAPIAAGGATAAAAYSLGGGLALYYAFCRGKHEITIAPENEAATKEVNELRSPELWGFTSFDGLKLKAHFYPALEKDSHRYAIVVHGFHGNYTDMMPYALHYLKAGYNVLMPHLRGHGLSEGNYVGFGYHDHYDLCGYIDLLREKDPESEIILHGMSMGAATVMMAAGEYLPKNVKCAIEDAGYTSAIEQCTFNLKTLYHLPAFPILNITDLTMQLRHHYSLKECTPIKSVAHANIPILFIHGDKDDFVPYHMLQPLYDACTSEKDILTIEGAGHVQSVFTNPEKFWGKVDEFVSKYVGKAEA